MSNFKVDYIPEILYEAPSHKGASVNPIPYIEVPLGKKMPAALYIFEYQQTSETEPDEKGREVPVWDQIPHVFVDMQVLSEVISKRVPGQQGRDLYDEIRVGLGMKDKATATKQGAEILAKIQSTVESQKVDIIAKQPERRKQYEDTHKEAMIQQAEQMKAAEKEELN